MVGWALGLEWYWRDPPRNRQWARIRFSPVSTPWRRRNLLEDHLWKTALCTQRSNWRRRMSRAHRPGSWSDKPGPGIVLYGPRAISPPAPAGGGGIRGGCRHPWGVTTGNKKTVNETRKTNGEEHTIKLFVGPVFCQGWATVRGARSEET